MPRQGSYKESGIPIVTDTPTFGNTYYVCNSTNRDDGITAANDSQTNGNSPKKPFSTIDFAINQCVAGRGDKIYVLEGHAESVATTGALIPDVANVSIIGIGEGNNMPRVSNATGTSGANATVVGITGQGTVIRNINFRTAQSFGSSGVFVGIGAADVVLDGCLFDLSSTAVAAATVIQVGAGVDRATIKNCEIINEGSSAAVANIGIELVSTGSTQKFTKIINNTLNGCFTRAAIHGTSESTFSMIKIAFNDINQTSSILTDTCIDIDSTKLAASVSRGPGIIQGNRVSANSTYAATVAIKFGTLKLIDNRFMLSTGVLGNTAGIASS